jgi:hypothetical protein
VADSAVGKTVHAWIERLLASVEKPVTADRNDRSAVSKKWKYHI